ncbi:hypothetical protein C7271_20490 [filamentous cyanobacterium CCP5]|nr:hypothetical protein C7271_20490 [filamentous cyanobacterium CCP5]
MGEAKRRKQADPDYGKKPKPAAKPSAGKGSRNLLGLKNVSKTEWIVWAVLLGVLAATFAATSAM